MSSIRRGGGDKYGTLRAQQETYLDRINRQILKDVEFPFIYVPALAQRLDIYKQKFMEFDTDGSDDLDFAEFKNLLETLGERKSHVQQKRLFALSSKSRRDRIVYRDFVDMILGDVLGLGIIFEEEQDIVDKAEIQRQKNSVFKLPKRMAPPPPPPPVQVTQPELQSECIYENFPEASPPSYRSSESVQEEATTDEETDEETDDENEETEGEEEQGDGNEAPKIVERTFTDITRNFEQAVAVRSEAPQGVNPPERNPPDYLKIFDNQAAPRRSDTSSVISETRQRAAPHDIPTAVRVHPTQPNPPPSVCTTRELPPEATRRNDTKMAEAALTPQQMTSVPYTYVCTDPNCPDSHPKPQPTVPATHAPSMCGDSTCTFTHSQVAPVSQPQQMIQPYAQTQYQPVQYTQQPTSQGYVVQNPYQSQMNQQYIQAPSQPQPIIYSSIPMQQPTQLARSGSFGYLPDAARTDSMGDFIVPQNVYVAPQQNMALQNQLSYGNQMQYYEIPSGYILQ